MGVAALLTTLLSMCAVYGFKGAVPHTCTACEFRDTKQCALASSTCNMSSHSCTINKAALARGKITDSNSSLSRWSTVQH